MFDSLCFGGIFIWLLAFKVIHFESSPPSGGGYKPFFFFFFQDGHYET